MTNKTYLTAIFPRSVALTHGSHSHVHTMAKHSWAQLSLAATLLDELIGTTLPYSKCPDLVHSSQLSCGWALLLGLRKSTSFHVGVREASSQGVVIWSQSRWKTSPSWVQSCCGILGVGGISKRYRCLEVIAGTGGR